MRAKSWARLRCLRLGIFHGSIQKQEAQQVEYALGEAQAFCRRAYDGFTRCGWLHALRAAPKAPKTSRAPRCGVWPRRKQTATRLPPGFGLIGLRHAITSSAEAGETGWPRLHASCTRLQPEGSKPYSRIPLGRAAAM